MPDLPATTRIYSSAFLCQDVIRDKADILTAIRIINAYTVRQVDVTVEMAPGVTLKKPLYLPITVSAILSFFSDEAADFEVTLMGISPDGAEKQIGVFACRTGGGAKGHVLNTKITIAAMLSGEHRIDIYVDDVKSNTISLTIIHAEESKLDPHSAQSTSRSAPSPEASD